MLRVCWDRGYIRDAIVPKVGHWIRLGRTENGQTLAQCDGIAHELLHEWHFRCGTANWFCARSTIEETN